MKVTFSDESATAEFGEKLGALLNGGDVIELIGDVGAGKTTLTRAIARGLGVVDAVQSPTFTISQRYEISDERMLVHYDFYRLKNAGIMKDELAETISDPYAITIVEWADSVRGVLPDNRLTLRITPISEESRRVEATMGKDLRSRVEGLFL